MSPRHSRYHSVDGTRYPSGETCWVGRSIVKHANKTIPSSYIQSTLALMIWCVSWLHPSLNYLEYRIKEISLHDAQRTRSLWSNEQSMEQDGWHMMASRTTISPYSRSFLAPMKTTIHKPPVRFFKPCSGSTDTRTSRRITLTTLPVTTSRSTALPAIKATIFPDVKDWVP